MKNCSEVLQNIIDDIAMNMAVTDQEPKLPSLTELCNIYGCSLRVLQRALASLVEKKIIKKVNSGEYAIINTDYEKSISLSSVEKRLANDILDSKYNQSKEEYRLPSSNEMAMVYGCSDKTARKAVNILIDRGIVGVKPGTGYFISQKGIKQIIQSRYDDILNNFSHTILVAKKQGLNDSSIQELFKQALKIIGDEEN